jgi:hypothetical protein
MDDFYNGVDSYDIIDFIELYVMRRIEYYERKMRDDSMSWSQSESFYISCPVKALYHCLESVIHKFDDVHL